MTVGPATPVPSSQNPGISISAFGAGGSLLDLVTTAVPDGRVQAASGSMRGTGALLPLRFDGTATTMVGCCGVVGGGAHPIRDMAETLAWTGEERSVAYRDDSLRLRGFTHPDPDAVVPGHSPTRDALVWVWGNVLGYHGADGYRARDPDSDGTAAEYCARLYDEHGTDFVSGTNGDFVGIVYDRERSTLSVFTDRLGSWRLFYTELDDGAVAFSSHVQTLVRHPATSVSFHEPYVVQHLTDAGGPFGVKTPLEGVEVFPPGAVTTFDLDAESISRDVDVYWRPRFDAVDEPYSYFVDEFVDRFTASVRERTRDRSKRYGVLLSGGTDSRLVLGAIDDDVDVVAFHMADWMSREARTAERVAMSEDVEFRFLRRDSDYYGRLLDRTPRMWNFSQTYNQAWAGGFMDEIRSAVDVLLTGHFCDTMFKGWFVPKRHLTFGPIGPVATPFEQPIGTIDRYVSEVCPPKPGYVDADVTPEAVLSENIQRTERGVEGYGVEFDSIRDYALGMPHYPASTDSFFRQSLREHLPLQMPVLDDRLIDLWASMPVRIQLRRNVVASALRAIDPDLSTIPHAEGGRPPTASLPRRLLGSVLTTVRRRLTPFDDVPAPWLDHSPWGDLEAIIRPEPFIEGAIREEEDLIRALPFLDWDGVFDAYESHLDGRDNTRELLRLVTFLKAPVTRELAGVD